MIWWEIFADEEGGLIVERHQSNWVFVPNRNPGRPRKSAPEPVPPAVDPHDPRSVLPSNISIDRWAVV